MYLCEVAIVSQLCIFPLYLLHGLCEDYLTCDIAFNAVMPLSRASTRGRYSRIEGVTSWYQSRLHLGRYNTPPLRKDLVPRSRTERKTPDIRNGGGPRVPRWLLGLNDVTTSLSGI